jgi:hypothetical protein
MNRHERLDHMDAQSRLSREPRKRAAASRVGILFLHDGQPMD